jgi:hypothetical protein
MRREKETPVCLRKTRKCPGVGYQVGAVDDPEIAILLEAARYAGTCFSGPCPSFIMFVWRNFVHEEE